MQNIYLDNAATTPVHPEVAGLMHQVLTESFGNPSSIHRFGQSAKAIIEKARRQVSASLHCSPGEIIFTGSGSESNNLALRGTVNPGDEIVTSSYEHSSIYETVRHLTTRGIHSSFVPPKPSGIVTTEAVEPFITEDSKLVSVMHLNNELGTVNPIGDIAAFVRDHHLLFHCDAVQSFGKLPIDLREVQADLLSISAHKIYGPKGVGALYVRKGTDLTAQILGGGQESRLRAGTENVAAIAGFGMAAELMLSAMDDQRVHLTKLKSSFENHLVQDAIAYQINGSDPWPGLISLTLPGVNAQQLLINLDLMGIAVSAGSACSAGTIEPSRVLAQIGIPKEMADCTLRISTSRFNTVPEMDVLADALQTVIKRLKKSE